MEPTDEQRAERVARFEAINISMQEVFEAAGPNGITEDELVRDISRATTLDSEAVGRYVKSALLHGYIPVVTLKRTLLIEEVEQLPSVTCRYRARLFGWDHD